MLNLLALFTSCLSLLLIPAIAAAQVNGPGPSDPALFDTVVDLPPDPSIGNFESIGGISGQTIQLNVMDDGSVGIDFVANFGSEVNISGGTVGSGFDARSGSEVNLSGGTVGHGFHTSSGSDVELFGGEFNLNGSTFTGSTITLSVGDVLTGTLTDGSAFIFSSDSFDTLIGVTLTPTALPTLDTTPIVVNTAFPTRPSGLRVGQTLTLQDGGQLGSDFEAVDATLNIEGGSLAAR